MEEEQPIIVEIASTSNDNTRDSNADTADSADTADTLDRADNTAKADAADKADTAYEDDEDEDAGTTCPVCMDQWSIGTEHRICALKCGHLFGRSCIERWIKDQGSSAKCPNCNKPAKKADLRDLWCKTIRAADSTELNELKQTVENERKLRRDATNQVYHYKLKLQVAYEDIDRLKLTVIDRDMKIKRFEELVLRSSSGQHQQTSDDGDVIAMDHSDHQSLLASISSESAAPVIITKGVFHVVKSLESSPSGGCKSLAISPTIGIAVFAQPSPISIAAMGQYGLKKYSIIDTHANQFIPLHSKAINAFQLNLTNELALTSSMDKKIKITSLLNNTTVQSYEVNQDPWCVAWNTRRDQQFFVGLRNCVNLYDMRNTSEHIYQTQPLANGRLLSMAYFSDSFDGLIVSDNQSSQLLEVTESSSYTDSLIDTSQNILPSHMLPFSGRMGTVDFCDKTKYALISCRPSSQSPTCTENLVKLEKVVQDGSDIPRIDVKPVKTFYGGRLSVFLSQSRILHHPTIEDKVLVASSDESSKGLKLWDSSDGSCFQTIPSKHPVRDMAMLSSDENTHILFCLNDKGLSMHKWDLV